MQPRCVLQVSHLICNFHMISNHRESSLRVDRSLEGEIIVRQTHAAQSLPPVALLPDVSHNMNVEVAQYTTVLTSPATDTYTASHLLHRLFFLDCQHFKIIQNIRTTHSKTQLHYQENFNLKKKMYLQHFSRTFDHGGNDLSVSLPFQGNPYDVVRINSLQSLLERKVWLKMLSHRKNFTVYKEVLPPGQACREAGWQLLVCHTVRYATITRTTSCATAALSVLLRKPAITMYRNQSTLKHDTLCIVHLLCPKFK